MYIDSLSDRVIESLNREQRGLASAQSLNESMIQYSVVSSLHIPSPAEQIADQAIQCNATFPLQSDVPLIARPSLLVPPIAGRAPWAGCPDDLSLYWFALGASDARRLAIPQRHCGVHRRTENAQRGDGAIVPVSGSLVRIRAWLQPCRCCPRL